MTKVRRGAASLYCRGSCHFWPPHSVLEGSPTGACSAFSPLRIHSLAFYLLAVGLSAGALCPMAQMKPLSSRAIAVHTCTLSFPLPLSC